jgi:hypothetical protein
MALEYIFLRTFNMAGVIIHITVVITIFTD